VAKCGITLMRNNWRLGLALGLAISVGGTAARAQVGNTVAGAQAGGPTVSAPAVGDANGGLSGPAPGDGTQTDPIATTASPPRPSRVSSFNRVTTGRSEVVSAPSQARRTAGLGGTSAVAGKTSPSAALGPYRARATQAQTKGVRDRAPASSTWRESPQRPTTPAPPTVRSTAHNYYPGLRPGQQPNANTPQAAGTGQRRNGIPAGALLGLGANTARVARPAPTRGSAPSSAVAAPRR
jgi:hypothetical protein